MRSEARDGGVSSNRTLDASLDPAAILERIDAWREALTRQASGHPARTVAIALGAGYLVGGGLISRFTARVVGAGLRIGFRMAALPVVSQQIVALGRDLISRDGGPRDDERGELTDAVSAKLDPKAPAGSLS